MFEVYNRQIVFEICKFNFFLLKSKVSPNLYSTVVQVQVIWFQKKNECPVKYLHFSAQLKE